MFLPHCLPTPSSQLTKRLVCASGCSVCIQLQKQVLTLRGEKLRRQFAACDMIKFVSFPVFETQVYHSDQSRELQLVWFGSCNWFQRRDCVVKAGNHTKCDESLKMQIVVMALILFWRWCGPSNFSRRPVPSTCLPQWALALTDQVLHSYSIHRL